MQPKHQLVKYEGTGYRTAPPIIGRLILHNKTPFTS